MCRQFCRVHSYKYNNALKKKKEQRRSKKTSRLEMNYKEEVKTIWQWKEHGFEMKIRRCSQVVKEEGDVPRLA